MNDLITKSVSNYADLKQSYIPDLEAGGDLEMTAIGVDSNLDKFFEKVDDIKKDMEAIQILFGKLQSANEQSKTVHKAKALKSLRDQMDKDVKEILSKSKVVKTKLETLDKANMESRRLSGCGEGTTTDRTRTTITNSLRKKLKDLMGEFQVLRQNITEEYKDIIERRFYTITGQHADEDTIEKIISTGESETVLQKAIQEQGRGRILETIHEIQERHHAVKEIERNLLELHQLFLDMSVLVEAQGEQLNDIEYHVAHAANYVERGTKQLQTAKSHQRSSRKWMCIAIIILLIIILIIVIPIVTSLKKS
ncbi:hypothetical protein SUGI_1170200 [Cryptomeria japonica]|uniref:syntaxin-124 n=1 Tax=Cryptomeria japonica TaxID=3369 RepID=UPI0024148562|nr:syntaxin-124 [Cryptomeria japonica]XP_057819400.2 syntaxin-124 [Cryptomeria japonica]XP_057819401.2 syntaxin-124 [Cryptomeria japonica]XP_057819402.2 syntaxin-124 [Cryptomeria japonica]XP_057819403.2 syntaxin-124 [Cryptomeria japonica]GLJ54481.1 hypothetical protein SUGI_1170200 [Cryptomeria japonica]